MTKKTVIDIVLDNSVAGSANAITTTASVPNGKTIRIKRFGGVAGASASASLQFGSGSSWQTVRAFGEGSHDFELKKEFVGDGTKLFRIVRQNQALLGQIIVAWVEAVVL